MREKTIFLTHQHIEQALLNYLQPRFHEGMLVRADYDVQGKGMLIKLELASKDS